MEKFILLFLLVAVCLQLDPANGHKKRRRQFRKPCIPSPCRNRGVCRRVGSSFRCSCKQGFTGYYCQIRLRNPCVPSPCRNRAACHRVKKSFKCSCKKGFTGRYCQIKIRNPCVPSPCRNRAACHRVKKSFKCSCKKGFTGRYCQIKIRTPCAPSPCRNKAVCHRVKKSFRCSCKKSFTGRYCQIKIRNPCIPSPCRNRGVCLRSGRTFICSCKQGFSGRYCQIKLENKCPRTVDITFIVDGSGSVGSSNFNKIKTFLKTLLSRFNVSLSGTHVGLILFSSKARVVFDLSRYTQLSDINRAIGSLRFIQGSTKTGQALKAFREKILRRKGDRPDVSDVVVVLSDGQAHDQNIARQQADLMKNSGVSILCIGVGKPQIVQSFVNQLKELASKPSYVFTSQFNALTAIENTLAREMCDIENKCPRTVDITFIVDGSGSVGSSNFNKIKIFLKEMLSRFNVSPFGTHVGLILFSSNARVVFDLSKYTKLFDMNRVIGSLRFIQGSTKTGQALKKFREKILRRKGDRPDVSDVVVVLSDGQAHDQSIARQQADLIKNSGVSILCIGVGKPQIVQSFVKQLKELASKPSYVFTSEFSALAAIENTLAREMCDIDSCKSSPCRNGGICRKYGQTYICHCPKEYEGKNCEKKKHPCRSKPCLNGGICVPKGWSYECSCPMGYEGIDCEKNTEEKECPAAIDLLFLVDSSSSIKAENFETLKKFVTEVASKFDISPQKAQIGLIQYSTSAKLVFGLTTFTDLKDLTMAVQGLKFIGGWTYTGKALKLAYDKVFGKPEDRTGVKNVLILLSDGKSQDKTMAFQQADLIKNTGAVIITVGIGEASIVKHFIKELEKIASTAADVFASPLNALQSIKRRLTQDACKMAGWCSKAPCKNGGVCIENMKRSKYTCWCASGHEGSLCDHKSPHCHSYPCQNRGVCIANHKDRSYECKCPLQFTGKNCEKQSSDDIPFRKVGCYEAAGGFKNGVQENALPELLFDAKSEIYIEEGWDDFFKRLALRCSKAAEQNNFRYFGLQFYAQCWAGNPGGGHYGKLASNEKCWSAYPDFKLCSNDHEICVGTPRHNYIYALQH